MKKFAAVLIVCLLSAGLYSAFGDGLSFSLLPPYSCTAGGFNLGRQQNFYRLTGPMYVPLPGYTYAMSNVVFNTAFPDGEAVLTLIPPSHRITLSGIAFVAPLWVDYGFLSAIPIHKLTVYISNPVNVFDTKIVCLVTGAAY